MSSLLRAKRKLETLTGPVVLDIERRTVYGRRVNEVHLHIRDNSRWLGSGATHAEAIEDAHRTLRIRGQLFSIEYRGDAIRDARKDEL